MPHPELLSGPDESIGRNGPDFTIQEREAFRQADPEAPAVKIFLSLDIPYPDPLSSGQDDIQGFVISSAVFVFKSDVVFSCHFNFYAN